MNDACNWIFLVEAALKIIAYNPLQYMTDMFNVLDLGVVILSFLAKFLHFKGQIAMVFRVVRVLLKITRILREASWAAGARKLANTTLKSLPALMNVAGLMLLMYFIYAVLGVSLFYNTDYQVSTPNGWPQLSYLASSVGPK